MEYVLQTPLEGLQKFWGRRNFFMIKSVQRDCTVNKGLAIFLSPSGMSITKLSLAGNNLPNPSPWKVWSKQIQESRNFSLQCRDGKEADSRKNQKLRISCLCIFTFKSSYQTFPRRGDLRILYVNISSTMSLWVQCSVLCVHPMICAHNTVMYTYHYFFYIQEWKVH